MNISSERPYTIFRNDYSGYTFYKIGLSKKLQTGEWQSGYINCKFRKGVVLENNTPIYIKKAWLSFDKKDKQTIPFIFVDDFTTVSKNIEQVKQEAAPQSQPTEADLFEEFSQEVELDDLPF